MRLLDRLPMRRKSKGAAMAAAGTFFVANPLISTFMLGVGLAIWWAVRQRA